MTPTEEFQKAHGAAYVKIVASPALGAAFSLLNVEKINKIIALTDEDIANHSREILADLRGHLKHENDLMTLHERKTFDLSQLPEETYTEETSPPATGGKRTKKT